MKAAVLEALGSPLSVKDVPEPKLGTGEVIVDVVATRVLAYAGDVFSGKRKYMLELPIVPGTSAIGRVREVGPDAVSLAPGDWVSCDPTVRARDDASAIILQGITATPTSAKLQKHFHDGTYAERVRIPTECAIAIGAIDPKDAPRWCALGMLTVPYGGYLAANLQPGEILVLSGATGGFGTAGVAAALAMGVRAVIATGRSEKTLAELRRRFGPRVIPVAMRGNEKADREAILAAAPGPIDVVLDLLPPQANASQVRAALMTVRPNGRVVLMGGVQDDLPLPYSWLMRNGVVVRGQWMYPREATARMAALIRAGLVDLSHFEVTTFPLNEVNHAVEHAAKDTAAFHNTVLVMA